MIIRHALVLALVGLLALGCSPKKQPRQARTDAPTESSKAATNKAGVSSQQKEKEKEVAKDKPKAPPNPVVTTTDEEGIIRGEVRWVGPLPSSQTKPEDCFVLIDGQKVQVPPPVPVKVSESNQGVADVVVWLAKPPATAEAFIPGKVKLTQKRGEYVPRVRVIAAGSTLELRTTDDVADFHGSGRQRFSRVVKRGETAQVQLERPGLINVHSETHPWIWPAHMRVLNHPYHAVTTRNGTFELPKVPPGDYIVVLWHPGWENDPTKQQLHVERKTAPVKIAVKQGAKVRWEVRLK